MANGVLNTTQLREVNAFLWTPRNTITVAGENVNKAALRTQLCDQPIETLRNLAISKGATVAQTRKKTDAADFLVSLAFARLAP